MQAHHVMKRLNELSSELHSVRGIVDNFNVYLSVRQREHLRLSENLENLWDALLGWASVARFDILWSDLPPFDQKTTLAQWITDLISIHHRELGQPQELLGKPQAGLIPPTHLQDIQIWRHRHPFFYGDTRILGYFYWGDIFTELDFWRKATNANLEKIEWTADSLTVHFIMRWKGAFQSIEVLDIEGTEDKPWTVTFGSEEPTHLLAVSTTSLLNAQLIAQLGDNRLVPVELQNGQLTVVLKITRADTKASHLSSVSSVKKSVLEQLGWYLIDRALPRYVEVSKRLESILSEEISRLEPRMLEDTGDKYWLNQLRDVLSKLRAAREVLMSKL